MRGTKIYGEDGVGWVVMRYWRVTERGVLNIRWRVHLMYGYVNNVNTCMGGFLSPSCSPCLKQE
jgi:hypothetical protein